MIPTNPGGYRDTIDFRDYQWRELGAAAPAFDWTKGYDVETELKKKLGLGFLLSPNNQQQSLSCGGQAWSKYAAVQEALFTGTYEERSAKYIYAQTHAPLGGSTGRDNAQVYSKQGVAKESILLSQPATEAFLVRSEDITTAIRLEAKLARSSAYANVPSTMEAFAQAIAANGGLIGGLNGSNNGTWLTPFPQPPKAGQPLWGHWVFFGKAFRIKNRPHVGFLNSWGPNCGLNGWQWINEDYFNALVNYDGTLSSAVWQGWAHVFNTDTPPGQFNHTFTTDLVVNEQSEEVRALQTALQVEGDFPATIKPTGFYGTVTSAAVLKFQKRYAVAPVSELNAIQGKRVGPKTRKKLNEIFS